MIAPAAAHWQHASFGFGRSVRRFGKLACQDRRC